MMLIVLLSRNETETKQKRNRISSSRDDRKVFSVIEFFDSWIFLGGLI